MGFCFKRFLSTRELSSLGTRGINMKIYVVLVNSDYDGLNQNKVFCETFSLIISSLNDNKLQEVNI